MRISDWSSDVCSSDLSEPGEWTCPQDPGNGHVHRHGRCAERFPRSLQSHAPWPMQAPRIRYEDRAFRGYGLLPPDRKRVVEGKSVSVRDDLGGSRSIKKKKQKDTYTS